MRFIRKNGRIIPIRDKGDQPSKKEKVAHGVARTSLAIAGASFGLAGQAAKSSLIRARSGNGASALKMMTTARQLADVSTVATVVGLLGMGVRNREIQKRQGHDKGLKTSRMKGLGDIATMYGTGIGVYFGLPVLSRAAAKLHQARRARNAKIINPEAMAKTAKKPKRPANSQHVRYLTQLIGGKNG